MSAAMTQMAKFYALPSSSAGCTADAKEPGAQAVLEKLVTTIPPVLAGTDIVVGTGEMESDQLLVLEQLVVDNELGHQIQRLAQGVDAASAKDLFEDIKQVGPGGHFLKARSTRAAARNGEFYMSPLSPRSSYEAWLGAGGPDLYGNARQKVTEILAEPLVDPLPGEVEDKLADILRRADSELA
jgi:trimethylamine--corrinoid protein Co-methyltransferase